MSDTRILYFREWQGYSFSSLKEKLSGFLSPKADEKRKKDKVNSIIDRLVRARFLKAFRKPKDDIGEILDGEEIEGDYNNDDNRIIYGFKYVGLIEIDGIIMYRCKMRIFGVDSLLILDLEVKETACHEVRKFSVLADFLACDNFTGKLFLQWQCQYLHNRFLIIRITLFQI